jgi:hypothetical protein
MAKRKRVEEPLEDLWTAKKVAEFLGVRRNMVYELDIPRIVISARCVRYNPALVRKWAMARQAS